MPLVYQAGAIAAGAQYGRNGGIVGKQVHATDRLLALLSFDAAGLGKIVANRGIARVAPGHEGTTRWRAHGRAGITLGKSGPGLGQAIDVWRLDMPVSIT